MKAEGSVWAWGSNEFGQLGDGTTIDRNTPVRVGELTDIIAIAAGYQHGLALKGDGTVWAWGRNQDGQLGADTTVLGSMVDLARPNQVTALSGITATGAGRWHSLAVGGDGTVWTWGYNGDGQLGTASTELCAERDCSSTPLAISLPERAVAVSGGIAHSLALAADGTVWAWGDNAHGQFGDGSTTSSRTPVKVRALRGAIAIAAGALHSLALKWDGAVWAWGDNRDGAVGDGTTDDRSTPVKLAHPAGVTSIAAGLRHSLALKADGTAWAWGWNYHGQLGNGDTGTFAAQHPTRELVVGLNGAWTISAGDEHSLALRAAP